MRFCFCFAFPFQTLCAAAKDERTSRVRGTRAARGIAPIRSSGQEGLSIEPGRPQRTGRFAAGAASRACSLW
jgi:hypothetical protein